MSKVNGRRRARTGERVFVLTCGRRRYKLTAFDRTTRFGSRLAGEWRLAKWSEVLATLTEQSKALPR